MRLIFFLALSAIGPLSAQLTSDPAASPADLALSQKDLGQMEFSWPAGSIFSLTPSGQPLVGDGVMCSVPLINVLVGKPNQFAAHFFKPADPEAMPHATLPAPPCK